jgi:hypothetical protein
MKLYIRANKKDRKTNAPSHLVLGKVVDVRGAGLGRSQTVGCAPSTGTGSPIRRLASVEPSEPFPAGIVGNRLTPAPTPARPLRLPLPRGERGLVPVMGRSDEEACAAGGCDTRAMDGVGGSGYVGGGDRGLPAAGPRMAAGRRQRAVVVMVAVVAVVLAVMAAGVAAGRGGLMGGSGSSSEITSLSDVR